MKIGTAIKTVRESLGLTQGDLARLAETNQPQVARWEAAASLPYSSLKRIAAALAVSVVDLIKTTQEAEPAPPACALCGRELPPGAAHRFNAAHGQPLDSPLVFCYPCLLKQTSDCFDLVRKEAAERDT